MAIIDRVPALTRLAVASREAASLLATVADPVRWRLLAVLADGAARKVSDLQLVAGVSQALLSYHLGVLRRAGLVRSVRRGRTVAYSIAPGALPRLSEALPHSALVSGAAEL